MEFILQSDNQNSWVLPPSWPSLHSNYSCIANDSTFGPFSNCYFDFTVFFEQCILSCVSSVSLLLFAPPRIFYLFRKDETTLWRPIRNIKLVSLGPRSTNVSITNVSIISLTICIEGCRNYFYFSSIDIVTVVYAMPFCAECCNNTLDCLGYNRCN